MKIKNVIKLLLITALLCVAGSWWYFEIYNKKQPISTNDNEGIIHDETALLNETISSGLKQMGELITAEYYFTSSETVQDVKVLDLTSLGIDFKTNIPLTGNSFTYSYDGQIMAGIDFKAIEVSVDKDSKTITIKIPKSKIISSSVDPDSYKFYEIKNNILNPISPEDYAVSFSDLIHSEEEKAIEKGLLNKANENGESLIKNFVKSYADDYKIVITK